MSDGVAGRKAKSWVASWASASRMGSFIVGWCFHYLGRVKGVELEVLNARFIVLVIQSTMTA